jgi:hypothetical protein
MFDAFFASHVVSMNRPELAVLRFAALGCALALLPLARALPPAISNLAVSQRTGEKLVEIDYDLAADASQVTVSLEISADGGVNYSVPATSLTGDVGIGVQPGKGKTILWNAGADWNGNYTDKMRFRLKADDQLAATPLAVVGASDFFTVTKGRSVARTLNLVNTGPTPAVVTALQLPAGFSASWSGNIPAGGAQSIPVTFTPASIGVFGGELRVVSPGFDHARHALRGTGSGPIRGIAFQDPASDLLGVLLPAAAADPALILLRKTGGGKRIFFVFPATTAVEMEMGAAGRLARVAIGLHRFTFADYTATTVKLTYQRPDGVESTGTVSLAATAASRLEPASLASFSAASTPPLSEEEVTKDEVDNTLEFIADPSNTHLLLNIYRLAGEFIYDKINKARETAQKLREDSEKLAVVAKNKVIVASEQAADAANLLAERAGLFVEELRQVDPQSETTAAIEVTSTDIQPFRNEWDQLLVKDKLDLEFTMTDLACEESVFADMNPECPQYQPPVALTADNIAFTVYSDEVLTRTLKPSSAATSVRLVKEPTTGLITDFNPTTGAFTYAPKAGFVGEDRFTYVAANRLDTSPVATVVITVKTQSCKNQINRDTQTTYYTRTCTDSIDTLSKSNGQKPRGYKRVERPPNGAQAVSPYWNSFTIKVTSDGEKVEYIFAEKNDYDSTGRRFAEEVRHWNDNVSSSTPYTIIKRTHTYVGTVKTTFVEIQEWGGGRFLKIRTYKQVGLGYPTDNTETTVERDEPLLTRESVEAFVASYMEKGDPTVAGMKQSIVYQLYTGDTVP